MNWFAIFNRVLKNFSKLGICSYYKQFSIGVYHCWCIVNKNMFADYVDKRMIGKPF